MNFHGGGSETCDFSESPQIIFFNQTCGLMDRETLISKEYGNEGQFSPLFADAIGQAKRVWIVDSYLSDQLELVNEIFWAITHADVPDARILTTKRDSYAQVVEAAAFWNKASSRVGSILTGTLPSRAQGDAVLPHDRFAIVDSELWHWGATVGGGFSGQNACSYGWSAVRTQAITWFEELWSYAR